tara:strand:+ start:2100 stop:2312 length:213 start_codon:yes stop_codon:yes gene_type:complete
MPKVQPVYADVICVLLAAFYYYHYRKFDDATEADHFLALMIGSYILIRISLALQVETLVNKTIRELYRIK